MNRIVLAAELERELRRATRHDRAAGVLFLDVDQFEQVNDTYGHTIGDQYMLHVAHTLRHELRSEHSSPRHGGDEFTVLLTDLPTGAGAADATFKTVANLRSALPNGCG